VVSNTFVNYTVSQSFGTKMPRTSWPIVALFPIAIPSRKERILIGNILSTLDKKIDTEQAYLKKILQQKYGLMQDLLTGKVPVKLNINQIKESHIKQIKSPAIVQPAFKRAVLAAEITSQLYQNPKFGSVKQEKIIDLCERHLGLHAEVDRTAYRQAAGPYDNKAKRSIENNFKNHQWFDVKREMGKGVKYTPLKKFGGHKKYFERYFGHYAQDIQALINLLRDADTQQCEIVATLYAVWNDFLIQNKEPTDEEIVTEILTNWHEQKQLIDRERWLKALNWMRQKNLIPQGVGKKTKMVD